MEMTLFSARLHQLKVVVAVDLQAQAVQTPQVIAVDRVVEMLTKELGLEALETHHL